MHLFVGVRTGFSLAGRIEYLKGQAVDSMVCQAGTALGRPNLKSQGWVVELGLRRRW